MEFRRVLFRSKDEGRIRYVGITTSHGSRHDEMEAVMKIQPLDFVQFTYNILDREAEGRLLPLAADRGQAVLVNRLFRQKALIRHFEGHPLPDWAGEIGAANLPPFKIGRASCREKVCQYVLIKLVAVQLTNKKPYNTYIHTNKQHLLPKK